ncbi:NACHT domain-containing NTPase [Pseudomonas sp. PAMC 26793]|uniref:NACHT domain-containing protein n=1 Tax=Pseudomonas sp. PAMC 26793 TaxID=1240676 RepID=UPI000307CA9C|nr:NACHT domain-containing protein [Pseudomonas sp. PAMC 26793]
MTGATLTTIALTNTLRPIITDLYNGAKGKVKTGLHKWSTDSGIHNTASTLIELNYVKTIWSGEEEKPLEDFYYPSKIEHQKKAKKIASIGELPPGNLVIEGIVGQGKSMFLRHLAASMIKNKKPEKIPIFLELRTITSKRSLLDSISLFFESIGIKYDDEIFDYLAKSDKIILLLDGFDEIPSECVSDVILELNIIQRKYKSLKIVISSRPRSNIQNASGFKVVKLVPLTTSDYDPFVSKLIIDIIKRSDVIAALENCAESIKGVVHTPLMLTLVVMIYQTEKEIPSTLSGFFDKLFGVVFAKHDKQKAGFNRQHYSNLSESDLKILFETFCFMAVQSKMGRSMTSSEFDKAFAAAKKYKKNMVCENENFRKDIIKVSCLMLEEGLDTITFLHKSILDYHAAAFIRDLSEAKAIKIYNSTIKNFQQWEHVLQFLKTIDPLRYSKHYTLKYLPTELEKLSALIEEQNSSNLLNFIDKLMPGSRIELTKNSVEKFRRPFTSSSELDVEICNAFFVALFKQCQNKSFENLIKSAAFDEAESSGNRKVFSGPVRPVLREFGDDEIWSMLRRIEATALQSLQKAAIDINNEIEEDDLLEEILSEKDD